MCVKWYLMGVLIYMFLMTNDIEQLFLWLLAVCMSSLEKCLFDSFGHFFFIGLFVYLLLSCKSYFYMLDSVLFCA